MKDKTGEKFKKIPPKFCQRLPTERMWILDVFDYVRISHSYVCMTVRRPQISSKVDLPRKVSLWTELKTLEFTEYLFTFAYL